MLYGREREQAAVGELLAGARGGRSGVLVLRGEPGIGKSALLDDAVAAAGTSFRVIRAAGIEYEAELPFAGLSLLFGAELDRLSALPAPQRHCLERAFGLTAASGEPAPGESAPGSADRLLTGLATLGLLAELATQQPLLCVLDDVQWLDRASLDAVLLAARRLQAEGVVLLLAVRDTGPAGDGSRPPVAAGFPELRLDALDDEAAGLLLDARLRAGATCPGPVRVGGHLGGVRPAADRPGSGRPTAADRPGSGRPTGEGSAGVRPGDDSGLRRRLLAEAAGNPLALCELPLAAAAAAAGAELRAPGGLPLTSRLMLAFHGRVTALPPACQTLLLVAAAEEQGELHVVLSAASALGADAGQLAPAEDAGLVTTTAEGRLAFRHPLLRTAVLQRAPLQQRLAAHLAIGEALDDGDRRTWHLALAATGPDAELADLLERTALRSAARGGPGGAAAYERAAHLTPDRDTATRRLVLAAEAATAEGRLAHAETLADRAAARTDRPDVRALLDHVRATAHFWRGSYPAAYRLLLEAAAGVDAPHAARMLLQAFHAAWYLGEEPVTAVLDRLAALPLAPDHPLTPLARYLPAAVLPALGRPAPPAPMARDTAAAARRAGADTPGDLVQLCGATLVLGRDDETLELAGELIAEARTRGTLGVLPTLQFFLAEAELFHGRHRDAQATADQALAFAHDIGQYQWVSQLSALLALLAALAGDGPACTRLVAAALDTTAPAGSAPQSAAPAAGEPWAQWALGLLDLGQGRAAEALDRLTVLTTGPHRHHVAATRAVPDLVEAAVRLGTPQRAAEPYERFARWATATGLPWAEALRLRCEALLGPDEFAESAYLAALGLHESRRPFEQARTALLYGEWLRRERRRTDARPHLRAALELFERLGAQPWADRARVELTATGTAAPARVEERSVLSVLTPQEQQIVRLAAQGLTNRDIAAQLFLSPRTVGHHLYKAYPKLGIASRGELAGLVPPAPSAPQHHTT